MKYVWESKVRTVLEHLNKERNPEVILDLLLKLGVLKAGKEERKMILRYVYSSTNHVYFGGTWDPMEMMKKKPEESLKEIKNTLDSLVEDKIITKEARDKRWKEILEACNQPPDPDVERYKKKFERIESLLQVAMKNYNNETDQGQIKK